MRKLPEFILILLIQAFSLYMAIRGITMHWLLCALFTLIFVVMRLAGRYHLKEFRHYLQSEIVYSRATSKPLRLLLVVVVMIFIDPVAARGYFREL